MGEVQHRGEATTGPQQHDRLRARVNGARQNGGVLDERRQDCGWNGASAESSGSEPDTHQEPSRFCCDGVCSGVAADWTSKDGRKMKHSVFCNDCKRETEIEVAGDLGQYTGDLLTCPCGESCVVPRYIDEVWALFAIADLLTPHIEPVRTVSDDD